MKRRTPPAERKTKKQTIPPLVTAVTAFVTPLLYEDEDRNPPIPNPSMAQPGASEIENRKSQITRIHPNPPEPQKMYSR